MSDAYEHIKNVLTVDQLLNSVSYKEDGEYIPSQFALEMVNFIKLVNGVEGESHKTPVLHMKMIDQLVSGDRNIINMCYRGAAKSTLMEYLIFYIAVFGSIPGFGDINFILYVSDSIENGVKTMRKSLEYRWENSDFLQRYLPKTRFTDVRWDFWNISDKKLTVRGFGAKTGVRGTRESGSRPQVALLDDLISDEDARSATVIASIEDTVYKAIDYALDPTRRLIMWNGTPFNQNDPLYKATESGAWAVNVYPVCEEFNDLTTEDAFCGAWPDRHTYKYVKDQYEKAKAAGRLDSFNQELMLRIVSEEDRLVQDGDIVWYDRSAILENKSKYNWYITTDFATSEKTSADFSVISIWAYSSNGDWLWVDGLVRRQLMDKNVDDLFNFVSQYRPLSVGIEISGQQQGFVDWIKKEMITRNIFFNLARDTQGGSGGLRPKTDKMTRFMTILPLFKTKKIWFPKDMQLSPEITEAMEELKNVVAGGFKSRHDDFVDTISMLSQIKAFKPSVENKMKLNHKSHIWEEDDDEEQVEKSSYIF